MIRSVDKCFKSSHWIRQCCFPWELIQFCNCPWVEGILVVIPNGCRLFHKNSASQTSFVAIFPYSHPYLNFAKSRFPGSSQIPYPVSAFPNPALSFGQVPYTVSVFPNPALSFGQIPDSRISLGVIHQTRMVHQVHQTRFRVTLPPNHLVTNEIATKKSTRHHIITLQQLTLYSPGIAGADLGGGVQGVCTPPP